MKHETSKKMLWIGRALSAFVILFLLFDAVIHISNIPPVAQASHQLGLHSSMTFVIGILELASLILFVFPQTAVLGAILLTGYLGGAVAINLRANTPLFSNTLFPIYIGLFVWGGLYFREKRLRNLIPFKK